jgi:hypothetical protein
MIRGMDGGLRGPIIPLDMIGRARTLEGIRSVLLIVLAAICMEAPSRAQIPDVAKPPPILNTAGQFSARRLVGPPVVDGREWIAANVETASAPGTVPVPTPAFALTLADCGDRGDFARCRLLFQRGGSAPVRIDDGFTGWVFVTPDARYIITEPLSVLDVREWKYYELTLP